jgi:hypothetical protein
MSVKLKAGALVVGLLGITALFLLQQQRQITRLLKEDADVRTQLNQMSSLRHTNVYLAEQLKTAIEAAQADRSKLVQQLKIAVETSQADRSKLVQQLKTAVETSQADRSELVRLRGQGERLRQLEQENAELKAQRQQRGRATSAVEYRNEQYGFGMTLPSDWSGYSVVAGTWQGRTHDEQGKTTGTYMGPEIILRHPKWTAAAPWQDIPVLVFTHDAWALAEQQKFGVSAAPTAPSKLGENAKFVFALPPRWIGFVDTLGQDEVGKVPKTFRAF